MVVHQVLRENFSKDIDGHLDFIKPGCRIKIDDRVVLIHPDDLRFLDKCAEIMPVEVESLNG